MKIEKGILAVGYSHYYRQKTKLDATQWKLFASLVKYLVINIHMASILAYEHDEIGRFPQVDDNIVHFNGKNENGHETFAFSRVTKRDEWSLEEGEDRDTSFNYCKTAMKPYDKYVTAVLILAKIIFKDDVKITSDGEINDWEEGRKLAETAWERPIHIVSLDGNPGLIVETEAYVSLETAEQIKLQKKQELKKQEELKAKETELKKAFEENEMSDLLN